MAENDLFFRHLLAVFLTEVGSRPWEQLFGKYWTNVIHRGQKEAGRPPAKMTAP
jgi:hypothetical protein